MNCYGTLTLVEHSPEASLIEPLTLTEIKSYLKLPEMSPAETDEDDLLETYIIAARETAEILQNRDLILKRYQLAFDEFPEQIELRAPLRSVERVRYRDSDGDYTVLVEGTDYIVDSAKQPGLILPVYGESWPSFDAWPSSAVEILFTSGYDADHIFWGSSGQRVLQGMKLLISHWYNGRLPFENRPGTPEELPFAVTSLLSFGAILRP